MAIGTQGSVGKGTGRSGPTIGNQGKTAGPIGTSKSIHGSSLNVDQEHSKVFYPTTTTH